MVMAGLFMMTAACQSTKTPPLQADHRAAESLREEPRAFVERFCTAERNVNFGGYPEDGATGKYESFCGEEVIKAVHFGHQCLAKWSRDFPLLYYKVHSELSGQSMMIPHICSFHIYEGFSEGPTTFRVGRVLRSEGQYRVEVHREWHEGRESAKWTDLVCLDRCGKGWVVADIKYGYGNRGGSLLEELQEFSSRVSKSLESVREEVAKLSAMKSP